MADQPHGGGNGGGHYAGHGGGGHYAGHGYGGHGYVGRGPVAFRGRSFGRLSPYEMGVWRGGHWIHSFHDGRRGWWWIVNGTWYFYPKPIYPFPDPMVPAFAVPGSSALYFCPPAQAYYPYVPSCPVPWQIVPAR